MTTLTRLPEVETPQLVVREIMDQDWRAFVRYIMRPEYQRFIAARLKNVDEVRAFVKSARIRQGWPHRRTFHLAAASKSGEVVGDGFIILSRGGAAEIGWGVAPRLWGRGLGGEIARVMTALAIERLSGKEVWCKVMAPNRASLRVAEKAGLKLQRTVAAYETGLRQSVDVHIFSLDRKGYYEAPY